jgi:hypothetical protein
VCQILGHSIGNGLTTQNIFNPLPGLILASVAPANIAKFEKQMKNLFVKIGTVTIEPTIKIALDNQKISTPLKEATTAYHSTFKNF